MKRLKAVLAMSEDMPQRLFAPADLARAHEIVDLDDAVVLSEFTSAAAKIALRDADLLITSWGCPVVDASVLESAPQLRAVIHAAGSVKGHITEACWSRGILVSSAVTANAVPVAEYTLAMILLSGKKVIDLTREYRLRRSAIDWESEYLDIGNNGRVVGIMGASRIGRRVIELLKPFDFHVLVADPYLSSHDAESIGAELVSLDDLLERSDILSLHAPLTEETRGTIDARRLALLRDGATVINTSRGAIVDQDAFERELIQGRINAVIDTTVPWIPAPESCLYDLPNVVLTPHLAGALGNEVSRLGALAVSELERHVHGEPFAHSVRVEEIARLA
ncbi:hydroxyacid dehydrogenase [Salinibacterium sp. PAMC 21357]|uniref:hydroxyacid dehydrogenase n=1 Tax=Salinibacterium sp. PAMC 21357 TaxID=1112215 RepID=UPI000288F073|nr:hydroxyacid dehydrogenase [Salinibacterium sp. PAMC 21357]